jgi:hypothetical protein
MLYTSDRTHLAVREALVVVVIQLDTGVARRAASRTTVTDTTTLTPI